MRVLFASFPGVGHFYPLVPLAWAFAAAGHEVVVTMAELTDKVAASGLTVVDPAPGFDAETLVPQVLEANPEFTAGPWTRPAPEEFTSWAPLFAGIQRPMVRRTVELAESWRPDLVVYEQIATFGLIAAARIGVPAIQRNHGTHRTGATHHAVAGHLSDLLERYGIDRLPDPAVTVEAFPESMLLSAPEGWFMREVPYNGGGVLDPLPPAPPDRPRIAATTSSHPDFGLDSLKAIVELASEVDAEFVLAGGADLTQLGELPPNVRSLGWVPYNTLYRSCTAVIHHGSGGSLLTALHANVPQMAVLVPGEQSTPLVGSMIQKRGIGLCTTAPELDAAMLTRLVTDDGLRAATAEVRAEQAAYPTPAEIVARITAQLG